MSKIPTFYDPLISGTNSGNKAGKAADGGSFDSLFNSSLNLSGLPSDLVDNILGKTNDNYSSHPVSSLFPFSPSFESTFGLSGPLPSFISVITSKLNLSATQNQALQDIAVKYKDITKTSANVQIIANELKNAGISS